MQARDGLFFGIGAAITLIVLLVVQSSIGTGFLSARTVTSTTTTTVTTAPTKGYDQVESAFANHLSAFGSRNVSALLSGYETNATVVLTGDAMGLQGNYSTPYQIEKTLGYFLTGLDNLTLSNETVTTVGVQGSYWIINSTFNWSGYSSRVGASSGAVSLQDSYALGYTWLIARETWNFIGWEAQYPDFIP